MFAFHAVLLRIFSAIPFPFSEPTVPKPVGKLPNSSNRSDLHLIKFLFFWISISSTSHQHSVNCGWSSFFFYVCCGKKKPMASTRSPAKVTTHKKKTKEKSVKRRKWKSGRQKSELERRRGQPMAPRYTVASHSFIFLSFFLSSFLTRFLSLLVSPSPPSVTRDTEEITTK